MALVIVELALNHIIDLHGTNVKTMKARTIAEMGIPKDDTDRYRTT